MLLYDIERLRAWIVLKTVGGTDREAFDLPQGLGAPFGILSPLEAAGNGGGTT
jgi:hypothetical protein